LHGSNVVLLNYKLMFVIYGVTCKKLTSFKNVKSLFNEHIFVLRKVRSTKIDGYELNFKSRRSGFKENAMLFIATIFIMSRS